MTSSVNGVSHAATGATEESKPKTADEITDKTAFLKLLVAQIRNQDPLNPADGIQFITQLAQFTQLEQMIGMHSELQQIREAIVPETQEA
jgi:flagellar basal-body rod modification protein FlgD